LEKIEEDAVCLDDFATANCSDRQRSGEKEDAHGFFRATHQQVGSMYGSVKNRTNKLSLSVT
jgi:hypothetical protein